MKYKDIVLRITGTFFGVVALIHLLRIITGVSVIVAGRSIPIGMNIIALIVTGFLCCLSWWVSAKK